MWQLTLDIERRNTRRVGCIPLTPADAEIVLEVLDTDVRAYLCAACESLLAPAQEDPRSTHVLSIVRYGKIEPALKAAGMPRIGSALRIASCGSYWWWKSQSRNCRLPIPHPETQSADDWPH